MGQDNGACNVNLDYVYRSVSNPNQVIESTLAGLC